MCCLVEDMARETRRGHGTKESVNMKQANLAQKDNLSQSQLLHTQNDRQMKTQAAGKQVKASKKREEGGGGEIFLMLLKLSSSGTMMQQTWSWKNVYAQDVNRVAKQQILSYFLVNFQNANHQCRQMTTPTMGSVWTGQGSGPGPKQAHISF